MSRRLNVLFIPTQASSVMYWRCQAFVECAFRRRLANFLNPLWYKDLNSHHQPWQDHLTDGHKDYSMMFIHQFIPAIEAEARQADAIVFQYVQEEGGIELFDSLKRMLPHTPILTEIDDNILSVPPYNQAFVTYSPFSDVRDRVVRQLRGSDGLIVSTPYLREIYAEFNPNIYVVPNSIDFKRWGQVQKIKRGGIRIGWAGGSGHEGDFEQVAPAIKRIAEKHEKVTFCFINGPGVRGIPDFLKDVPRIEHKLLWKPILKYPQMLASQDYDIILGCLRDSAFNRGKSNLKWLEAGALRTPCIAAKVGHFAETVRDGVDGMLYSNPEEFERKLTALVENRALRTNIGAAAYETIRNKFNAENVTEQYVWNIQDAIKRKAAEPEKKADDGGWASIPTVHKMDPQAIPEQRIEMLPGGEAMISVEDKVYEQRPKESHKQKRESGLPEASVGAILNALQDDSAPDVAASPDGFVPVCEGETDESFPT